MTILRQTAIAELEKVPEDKLNLILQFITTLSKESENKKMTCNIEKFIMPPTERGQNADSYIRELRDNDRF
ncbi:hypothetical protein VSQ32_17230 [Lachnospiraceae bacterium KK002]